MCKNIELSDNLTKKYIYGRCFNPQKVKIYNQVTHNYELKEVPCGKCYHCRMTKINEWVSRMYCQSLFSKYVYFVTLTYSPFDFDFDYKNNTSVVFRLAYDTNYILSDINTFHKLQYQPLTLSKSHLQKFFKRLRKNTGVKFQYFACGEYGSCYSRPHYHVIIWSNYLISKDDIQDSWSIEGYKIGDIDFNDLRANGSFSNLNIRSLSENKNNASFCFKYVCKYLLKDKFFNFDDFQTKKYLLNLFYSLKSDNYGIKDFTKDYSPFVLMSRNPALGFDYFVKFKKEFLDGNFRLFNLPSEICIFPSYFVRKTKEELFSLRLFSQRNSLPAVISQVYDKFNCLQDIIDFNEDNISLSANAKRELLAFNNKVFVPNHDVVKFEDLDFYDVNDKLYFRFRYDSDNKIYFYSVFNSDYKLNKLDYITDISLFDFLQTYRISYFHYISFLNSLYQYSIVSKRQFKDFIDLYFKTNEEYENYKSLYLNGLLKGIQLHQDKYLSSKNLF